MFSQLGKNLSEVKERLEDRPALLEHKISPKTAKNIRDGKKCYDTKDHVKQQSEAHKKKRTKT